MNYKDYYYIIFIILVLLLIFIKYFTPLKNSNWRHKKEGFQETFKEGLDIGDIGDTMRKTFEAPFRKLGDDIKGPFVKFGNDTVGKFTDIFNQLADFGNKIKSFGERFEKIGYGIKDIFEGIGDEFKYFGIGVGRGFNDIGLLIAYAAEYVFSYVICGVKYISNLPNCILYYIVDAFLRILYLPIRITLWFLYTFLNINLYPTEKQFWDFAGWVDSKIYTVASFNILRWPKNIRDQCYNCKRLKTSVLVNKARDIDNDFKTEIPRLMNIGVDKMRKGGDEIKSGFGL